METTKYWVVATFSERTNPGTDKEYWTSCGHNCKSRSGPFESRDAAESFAAGLAQQRGEGRMLAEARIEEDNSEG